MADASDPLQLNELAVDQQSPAREIIPGPLLRGLEAVPRRRIEYRGTVLEEMDIDAGRAVGCYTVLIERPYSECREADVRVADLAAAVFHEFVSLSIQHLLHGIGQRMLTRWPQLSEISFDAQNRLWDLAGEAPEDEIRRHCEAVLNDRGRL